MHKEYAMYKGDELLFIGTIPECAKFRDVKEETIKYYLTPAYGRKIERRNKPKNYLTMVPLNDEEDSDECDCEFN